MKPSGYRVALICARYLLSEQKSVLFWQLVARLIGFGMCVDKETKIYYFLFDKKYINKGTV